MQLTTSPIAAHIPQRPGDPPPTRMTSGTATLGTTLATLAIATLATLATLYNTGIATRRRRVCLYALIHLFNIRIT